MSGPSEEVDDVQMAIAALSSMKAASSKKPKPSLPPISSMLLDGGGGQDHGGASSSSRHHSNGGHNAYAVNGAGQQHHPRSNGVGGLQYSYVTASSNNGLHDAGFGNSSTSTSALTHSTATTPSGRTATSVSSPGTPPFERERIDGQSVDPQIGDEGFIGRVSQLPLVSGTLKLYERGRNSSRVVKVSHLHYPKLGLIVRADDDIAKQYGTDFMEGTVKTISQPVINRVVGPSLVGQIDNFACRQLDRVSAERASLATAMT